MVLNTPPEPGPDRSGDPGGRAGHSPGPGRGDQSGRPVHAPAWPAPAGTGPTRGRAARRSGRAPSRADPDDGGALAGVPLLILLVLACGLAMGVPAGHGFLTGQAAIARSFLYSGLMIVVLAVFLIIATRRRRITPVTRGLFPMLAAIYAVIPAILAVPLADALPQIRPADAWFEMVASFTTTGASVLETPRRLPDTIHLWRGMAGWFGGLFILVSASAYMAPMGLGGFEMLRPPADHPLVHDRAGNAARQTAAPRFTAHLRQILPLYAGLTGLLWLLLALSGMPGFPALMAALAVLSTSGILARETLGAVGPGAELALFAFLFLAVSRAFIPGAEGRLLGRPRDDPQLRLALALVLGVIVLVAARHLLGGFQPAEGETLPRLGTAIWGAAFTGLSFLTTTGLVNDAWIAGRAWSGLNPPGMVLLALALMGGGVATTAGGVKLMRLYALGRMGAEEMQRLLYPSLVSGGGRRLRFIAGQGARLAWLFVMAFAAALSVIVALLLALGLGFETAIIFAAAALTTTGPLAQFAGEGALHWALLPDAARPVLGLGMILGRLEILAVLAMMAGRISRD